MMPRLLLFVLIALLLSSCTKRISKEQYIGAMEAIGCSLATEGTSQANAILTAKGVTQQDIQVFRQHMDPRTVIEITTEIAKRVAACHGVNLPK